MIGPFRFRDRYQSSLAQLWRDTANVDELLGRLEMRDADLERHLGANPQRTFTPALKQTPAPDVTHTVTWADWVESVDGMVHGSAKLAATGAGTAGGEVFVTQDILPLPKRSEGVIGGFTYDLTGAGTTYVGAALFTDPTSPFLGAVYGSDYIFRFRVSSNDGFLGNLPSFAAASGDVLTFDFHYMKLLGQ